MDDETEAYDNKAEDRAENEGMPTMAESCPTATELSEKNPCVTVIPN